MPNARAVDPETAIVAKRALGLWKTFSGARGVPSDALPVFWHDTVPELYQELLHDVNAKAVVDITPGSGVLALEALRKGIKYVGLAKNEAHSHFLDETLCWKIVRECKLPENVFDAELATEWAAIVKTEEKKEEPEEVSLDVDGEVIEEASASDVE